MTADTLLVILLFATIAAFIVARALTSNRIGKAREDDEVARLEASARRSNLQYRSTKGETE